jgi:1-acyl-sn-glycerol-3-phosphate acyltransferase
MTIRWFLSWIWVFPLFRVLTGIKIKGKVPKKGAYIIACNHVSFLDPPIVGICAGREIHFLAKIGLFETSKMFARLIRAYNAIPISGVQGLRTAIKLLRKGEAVVIFPEGTRSRKGHMLPFNPGVSYLALHLRVPVIPVFITNSNKRFAALMLRLNTLRITFGEPISPRDYKNNRTDMVRFANRLQEEIIKLR